MQDVRYEHAIALANAGRHDEAADVGRRAVSVGALLHPMQAPKHLDRSLPPGRPWVDDAGSWRAVRSLRAHFVAIREEVLRADAAGVLGALATADSEGLTRAGRWSELNFFLRGEPPQPTLDALPATSAVLASLPEAVSMVRGAAKLSFVRPGTHILPHCGPTNTRLRIHLGISIPPGPQQLIVGGEPRTWAEGEALVFDDSYFHEVWHNASAPRIALVVDVWNQNRASDACATGC